MSRYRVDTLYRFFFFFDKGRKGDCYERMGQSCYEIKSAIAENRYLAEKNASAIMMNDTANTQKVLDKLNYNTAHRNNRIYSCML